MQSKLAKLEWFRTALARQAVYIPLGASFSPFCEFTPALVVRYSVAYLYVRMEIFRGDKKRDSIRQKHTHKKYVCFWTDSGLLPPLLQLEETEREWGFR